MKRVKLTAGATAFVLLCAMFWALVPSEAPGAVPQLINFQGQLKDGSGNPVPNGSYSVAVRIYDVLSGPNLALWSDTFSVNTTGGLFNVMLGSEQPLPPSLFANPNLYVGVQVGAAAELSPRTQLTSVPYSARVGTVDGATGGVISGDVSIQSELSVAGNIELNPPPDDSKPALAIQGALRQSANLMEIQNSAGTPLVTVDPAGVVQSCWIRLQAVPGQTDNPFEVFEAGGIQPCVYITPSGGLFATTGLVSGPLGVGQTLPDDSKLQIATGDPDTKGIKIVGAASQRTNLLEIFEFGGIVPCAKVASDGGLAAPKLALTSPAGDDEPLLAFRWLAQLSANIVEYINEDDITVGFVAPDGGLHTMGASSFGDKVGIGTSTANSKLQINGALATAITNTTSNLTLTGEHSVILCSLVSSSITVDLPSAIGIAGRQYTIKYLPPTLPLNGVIIEPFGSETIDGSPNYVLPGANFYATIVSDGVNWWVVANGP